MSRPRYMRAPRVEMSEDQRQATKACHAVNLPSPFDLGRGASFWSSYPDTGGHVWQAEDGHVVLRPTPQGWLVTRDGEGIS